jgi:hypothetical protein
MPPTKFIEVQNVIKIMKKKTARFSKKPFHHSLRRMDSSPALGLQCNSSPASVAWSQTSSGNGGIQVRDLSLASKCELAI